MARAGIRGEGLRRPSAGLRREPVEIIRKHPVCLQRPVPSSTVSQRINAYVVDSIPVAATLHEVTFQKMSSTPTLPGSRDNELYLAVLPLVHYSRFFAGERYEEVMTLVPDRNFATEFLPNEVDRYIQTFRNAAEEKLGGPVRLYHYEKRNTADGRVYVVVMQHA